MIKRIYILIFMVLLYSCNTVSSEDKKAIKLFEFNIEIIEKYFNEETIKGNQLDQSIFFLEDLTKIKSDIGDGFVDIKNPTIENLKQWKSWYKKNKNLLYWDNQNQKVKVKKNDRVLN